jgi:hypothetical protein
MAQLADVLEQKYFAEFEFSSDQDSVYWFPILINERNLQKAEAVKNNIEEILKGKFSILRTYPTLLYEEPMYSIALKKYINEKKRAQILKLSLKHLTLDYLFENKRYISFNQHIVMVPQNLILIYKHIAEMHLENLSFLTTQFNSDLDLNQEFLMLKIY